jgi:alkanesulfonate monooxygenase SsuD/methylene tetrahydromethanopterin reductase-like flavin-dependent oxidoreductase (luciferase family)
MVIQEGQISEQHVAILPALLPTIVRTSGTFVALPGAGNPEGGRSAQTLTGSPEEIAAQLHAFRSAGVRHMSIILDPWDARGIEGFGPVIQALRKLEG